MSSSGVVYSSYVDSNRASLATQERAPAVRAELRRRQVRYDGGAIPPAAGDSQ
jgi:hypothetical protein